MSRKLNEIKSSLNSQIQDAFTTAIAEEVLPSIQNTLDTQGELSSPWWTEGPLGYNGTPKLKIPRKRGKIAPKRVLRRKIVDECLERVQ